MFKRILLNAKLKHFSLSNNNPVDRNYKNEICIFLCPEKVKPKKNSKDKVNQIMRGRG